MTIPNPGNLHQFSRVLTIAHIDTYCIPVAIVKKMQNSPLTNEHQSEMIGVDRYRDPFNFWGIGQPRVGH